MALICEVPNVAGENDLRQDDVGLRTTDDPTDEEWGAVAPLIRSARPSLQADLNIDEILDGLMNVLGSVCHWRGIP